MYLKLKNKSCFFFRNTKPLVFDIKIQVKKEPIVKKSIEKESLLLFLARGFRLTNSTLKKTKLSLNTVLKTKNRDNNT